MVDLGKLKNKYTEAAEKANDAWKESMVYDKNSTGYEVVVNFIHKHPNIQPTNEQLNVFDIIAEKRDRLLDFARGEYQGAFQLGENINDNMADIEFYETSVRVWSTMARKASHAIEARSESIKMADMCIEWLKSYPELLHTGMSVFKQWRNECRDMMKLEKQVKQNSERAAEAARTVLARINDS